MVRKNSNTLILLGGSAAPRQLREYDIGADAWSAPLDKELKFDLVNGACVSLQMKGMTHCLYSPLTVGIFQTTASSTERRGRTL